MFINRCYWNTTLVTPTQHSNMSTSSTDSTSTPPAVAAISIKLPPFWLSNTEVWFAQVKAQFTTRSISSQKTRFDYVVNSLSPEFATEVHDLLLKPPSKNQYDKLKKELVKRTTASEQRKLQQLISSDRKPTQVLHCMQQLLGEKLGSSCKHLCPRAVSPMATCKRPDGSRLCRPVYSDCREICQHG